MTEKKSGVGGKDSGKGIINEWHKKSDNTVSRDRPVPPPKPAPDKPKGD